METDSGHRKSWKMKTWFWNYLSCFYMLANSFVSSAYRAEADWRQLSKSCCTRQPFSEAWKRCVLHQNTDIHSCICVTRLCNNRIEKTSWMWFTYWNTSCSVLTCASRLNCSASTSMTCSSVTVSVASVHHLSAKWPTPSSSALMLSFGCILFIATWSPRTFFSSILAAVASRCVSLVPCLLN